MPEYKSPGVYVEEVPSSIKPIAGASTSTVGFLAVIGDTVKLPARNGKWMTVTLPAGPVFATRWGQFTAAFGDFTMDSTTASEEKSTTETGWLNLAHAVYGFFNNGGSRCYIVRASSTGTTDVTAALQQLGAIDDISIVAAPGAANSVRDAVATHCSTVGGRFAILDGPPKAGITQLITSAAASVPSEEENAEEPAAEETAKKKTSRDSGAKVLKAGDDSTKGLMPPTSNCVAWYFPWINVASPSGSGTVQVPPSGHIAGIYARVDTQRGVHKSPANETILGAVSVTQPLGKGEQDQLNPKGVNCIRVLNGNVTVWGARTLGGDDNKDMMYVSVKRTMLFLKKSIENGTQWVVFEPNTPALWQRVTRNVEAFLTNVWRDGALFGETPQEAFYVQCNADNNPESLRNIGQLVIEVGVALVRPAEFVIFRISQISGPGK